MRNLLRARLLAHTRLLRVIYKGIYLVMFLHALGAKRRLRARAIRARNRRSGYLDSLPVYFRILVCRLIIELACEKLQQCLFGCIRLSQCGKQKKKDFADQFKNNETHHVEFESILKNLETSEKKFFEILTIFRHLTKSNISVSQKKAKIGTVRKRRPAKVGAISWMLKEFSTGSF